MQDELWHDGGDGAAVQRVDGLAHVGAEHLQAARGARGGWPNETDSRLTRLLCAAPLATLSFSRPPDAPYSCGTSLGWGQTPAPWLSFHKPAPTCFSNESSNGCGHTLAHVYALAYICTCTYAHNKKTHARTHTHTQKHTHKHTQTPMCAPAAGCPAHPRHRSPAPRPRAPQRCRSRPSL